jgi:hypothetical protein
MSAAEYEAQLTPSPCRWTTTGDAAACSRRSSSPNASARSQLAVAESFYMHHGLVIACFMLPVSEPRLCARSACCTVQHRHAADTSLKSPWANRVHDIAALS